MKDTLTLTALKKALLDETYPAFKEEDLDQHLILNLWLRSTVLVNPVDPGVLYTTRNFLVEKMVDMALGNPLGDLDILPILKILHSEIEYTGDIQEYGYRFNRYYRVEFDCFGNRGYTVQFLKTVTDRVTEKSPKELNRVITMYLRGYLHSVQGTFNNFKMA